MGWGAGDRVDRYVLDELLGEGGQGSVWRATDPLSPNEARAVKLIEVRRASDTELERARREARALARLDHPSLCRCHGLFEDVHHHALGVAMDLAEGVSLATAIVDPRMTLALREQALLHVAGALAHVHAHGLVHRDVKPLNVVVGLGFWSAPEEAHHIKLVDFGIADMGHGKRLTQAGHVIGTPPYMAPEQIDPSLWGDERTAAIDVFSFAVMCWLVMTGRHPTGLGADANLGDYAVAYREAASGEWPPRLPAACALTPALTRALDLRARDRWPDCGALLGAVASASLVPGTGLNAPAAETKVHGAPRSAAVTRASGPARSLRPTLSSSAPTTVEEHPVFSASPSPTGSWKWAAGLVLLVPATVGGYWLWSSSAEGHGAQDESTQEAHERDGDDEEDGDDHEPITPPTAASSSTSTSTSPAPLPSPAPQTKPPSTAHDSCANYANEQLPTGTYIARLSHDDHLDAKGKPFVEPHSVLMADREHQRPADGDALTPEISTSRTISALMCTLFSSQFKPQARGDTSVGHMRRTVIGRRILRGEPLVRVTFRGRAHANIELAQGDCRDLDANVTWLRGPGSSIPESAKWVVYLEAERAVAACDRALTALNRLYAAH